MLGEQLGHALPGGFGLDPRLVSPGSQGGYHAGGQRAVVPLQLAEFRQRLKIRPATIPAEGVLEGGGATIVIHWPTSKVSLGWPVGPDRMPVVNPDHSPFQLPGSTRGDQRGLGPVHANALPFRHHRSRDLSGLQRRGEVGQENCVQILKEVAHRICLVRWSIVRRNSCCLMIFPPSISSATRPMQNSAGERPALRAWSSVAEYD